MTYSELMEMITGAAAEEWLHDDVKGVWTLKRDVGVTIRERRSDVPQPFKEAWARGFPDAGACLCIFELWYGASPVETYTFARVDGGRADLPCPRSQEGLEITTEQFSIAVAVNGDPGRLHTYLNRAGIRAPITPASFVAYLERQAATPGGLEAAMNRRLAKKLGCKPEEVDKELAMRDPAKGIVQ